MTEPDPIEEDLDFRSTLSRLFDDGLDEAEQQALQAYLLRNPQARRTYIQFAQIEAELHWLGSAGVRSFEGNSSTAPNARWWRAASRSAGWWGLSAVTAVAAGWIAVALLLPWGESGKGNRENLLLPEDAVAQLVDTRDALWSASSNPTRLDTSLRPGRMTLSSGEAVIRFRTGAMLTMIAPCSVDLQSDRSAELSQGRIAVEIPSPIDRFFIRTPAGDIFDRGTVFGVSVGDRGATEIHVLEGEVEVLPTHPSPATPHLIQVGRAEIFGRGEIPKWEEIECTPEAYRSLFPGSIAPRDAKWKRIHEEDFQTPPDFAHLWEIRNVPFGPSRPAVTWEQGHIKLSDRGYLVFRKPFESSSTLGLRVAGRWTIVSPKDQPEVVLHTDAIPHPPYGDVAEGVSVGMLLEEGHGTITILPRTADLSLEGGISVARIPARIGDSFYFEATSLGQEIRFRVWNANENATTATLRGRVLGTYRHHQVAFHNRNRQRWPMVLHLNQVRFDQMAGTSGGNPDPPAP